VFYASLQEISLQQGVFSSQTNYLFGLRFLNVETTDIGGITTWNILRNPFLSIAFIIYFISSLAEANRAPFDLPEAESELIAGFHTEYSGFRWAIVFLSEYGMMLLVSLVGAILFLGSWNTPLPNIGVIRLANWTSGEMGKLSADIWGAFWLFTKAYLLILVQMWVRWTFPRLRMDQLMYLCWKVLTPIGLLLFFVSAVWKLLG
jgi:NADH-quinone oxidoreductase subunit H